MGAVSYPPHNYASAICRMVFQGRTFILRFRALDINGSNPSGPPRALVHQEMQKVTAKKPGKMLRSPFNNTLE